MTAEPEADIAFPDEGAVTRTILGATLALGAFLALAAELSALLRGAPSGTRSDAVGLSLVLGLVLTFVGASIATGRRRVRLARRSKTLVWRWSTLGRVVRERAIARDRISALELVEHRGRYRVHVLYAEIDGDRRRICSRVGEEPPGAARASSLLGVPLRRERRRAWGSPAR